MGKEPVNLRSRIAANLRVMLKRQKISAPKLAELAKVDPKTVNNMVHGRFDPRLSQIEKCANALGLATWQLLATDFTPTEVDLAQIGRLLERFSQATDDGRTAILQVAQLAGEASR